MLLLQRYCCRFNLVLTDVQMPDMDGYSLTRNVLSMQLAVTPLVIGTHTFFLEHKSMDTSAMCNTAEL